MFVTAVHSSEQSSIMFHYLTVALLAVAAPLAFAEPSGLLGIGGPIIGGPGLLGGGHLGLGLGGLGLGGAVLAAPASVSVQKTIVAHPAPIAVAAPVAVATHGLAIPSPAAATVVAGPSGIITAKQSLAGTVATVAGPASINHGIGLGGHGW